MLLKTQTFALCSSGSVSSALFFPASITSSTTSPSTASPRPRKKASSTPKSWRPLRHYATVQDGRRDRSDASNTPSWPTSKNPTPYDIFDQSKSAPYNKKAFHRLVKLYHPDLHQHASQKHNTISRAAKLERYRLVVAANYILSDPARRRSYDLYGAGWAGQPDMHNSFREADRAWRTRAGSAAHNATWEDWERWHDRDSTGGKRQDPLYMSNGMFVITIMAFVLMGSWGQATRAGSHGMHLMEMQEERDSRIGEDMSKMMKEKAFLSREGRVENFLRQREGWTPESIDESRMRRE